MKVYEIITTWDIGEFSYVTTTEAIYSDKNAAKELKSKIENEVKYYQNIKCPLNNYDATDNNWNFLEKADDKEREEFINWNNHNRIANGFIKVEIYEREANKWNGLFQDYYRKRIKQ